MRAMRKAVEFGVRVQPDLVALTGDILSGPRARDAVVHALERLRPPLGIFAVLGNHDVGDTHDPFSRGIVIDDWGAAPVTVLRDSSAVVEWRGCEIELGGVDPRLFADGANLPAERLFTRPGAVRVLLSHFPDVPAEMPPGTCSLALCGHLHGGQICLPGPQRQGAPVAPLLPLQRGRLRGARGDGGRLARARHHARAVPALRAARGQPAAAAAARRGSRSHRRPYTRFMTDPTAAGAAESVHSPGVSAHISHAVIAAYAAAAAREVAGVHALTGGHLGRLERRGDPDRLGVRVTAAGEAVDLELHVVTAVGRVDPRRRRRGRAVGAHLSGLDDRPGRRRVSWS